MVMFTNDIYEDTMYERVMAHATCLRPLRVVVSVWLAALDRPYVKCTALRIVSHDDGKNVAIECTKCKEVIIDFNKPDEN